MDRIKKKAETDSGAPPRLVLMLEVRLALLTLALAPAMADRVPSDTTAAHQDLFAFGSIDGGFDNDFFACRADDDLTRRRSINGGMKNPL